MSDTFPTLHILRVLELWTFGWPHQRDTCWGRLWCASSSMAPVVCLLVVSVMPLGGTSHWGTNHEKKPIDKHPAKKLWTVTVFFPHPIEFRMHFINILHVASFFVCLLCLSVIILYLFGLFTANLCCALFAAWIVVRMIFHSFHLQKSIALRWGFMCLPCGPSWALVLSRGRTKIAQNTDINSSQEYKERNIEKL